jgi:hypothetical protein
MIGDRIPTELVISALTALAATYFTNASASYRTQALQIYLCNTGATQRTITLYKNGVAAANQIANSIVLPANGSAIIDTKLVFTGTQTLSAKQDTGTDVTMAIYGIVEQIV